ncbi:uncharacterized protein NECHADRAFT_88818 [Fusarium vanettenii 77-13-4]|uniref:Uncharacterized protein n=1 Tax=Fusarium vanettenii (strain ATCC MYA-4622 / CBS 123669 / FGSC 9596 / NRRL 45880 / 77-13-4) TaxID=660122 RepID=C7ZQ13_FUSV7|nr:uncharacterized protein NECHADRAFT_88818 [Fusarium vanettenii 77-13-4]EEU33892.1 predicted protein [Fusarium vanettenii 77-13-4]
MAEHFGSNGFDFGGGGFEFRDSSFGGSGFGHWSFPSSSPILNNHSTFDFFRDCNPYSGSSLDRPKPSAYSSVPKGPGNHEYDFFVSNLREGDASSSSEPPMAPTSDTTFMPRTFTTQRGSSNDSPGYNAPLNFIDQSWVTWSASGSGLPKLDIQLKTPRWAKAGRLEYDHSFTFDPHADLTFPCTTKRLVYKSPLERVEFGLGSYGDLPTWTTTQDAWIAFDVTGSRSKTIFSLASVADLVWMVLELQLTITGIATQRPRTCFVEHHHKVDGCGEGKVKVQHRTKSSDERGAHRDASMLPNWLLDPDRSTVLTACGPHEVAIEPRFDGQRHGALSHLLLKVLEGVGRKYRSTASKIINHYPSVTRPSSIYVRKRAFVNLLVTLPCTYIISTDMPGIQDIILAPLPLPA